MAESNGEVVFHSGHIFAGDTGTIDYNNKVIKGVSLITGGIEAEGHNLVVDGQTLSELRSCAQQKGRIPCNLDHGSGVSSICGYLTDFRIDGNKLRGDLHLLESHDETPKLLERAEKMPDCFGLSVAFKGPPKGVPIGAGKMAARCEKLLSVDVVTRPAANTGLFSIPEVDNSKKSMAQENAGQPTEPTMADVIAHLNAITQRLDQHDQFNQQLVAELNGEAQGQDEVTLADLYEMDDAQLEALGLTREEVNAAVEEALAGAETEGAEIGETGSESSGEGAEGESAGVGAGVDASPAGATGMKSLEKRLVQLETKDRARTYRMKAQAEEHELDQIEQKALTLAHQRDEAIQFAEQLQSEVDALRVAVRTGTRPVKAGVDNGMRMFSATDNGQLHDFQVRVKQLTESGKSEAEAIRMAQKENPGLHADWIESLQKRRVVTV